MNKYKISIIGMMMGIAEVIPGVSGGTIAFITGIYQQLIHSISSIDKQFFVLLKKGEWKKLWQKIDGEFLVKLGAGMFLGIVFGVIVISFLLENYSEILWGGFFGLVLSSAIYMILDIKKKSIIDISLILVGFVLAYIVTHFAPTTGSDQLVFIFLSGSIAISAMILPGISGSFILLLLGMYSIVIPEVKNLILHFNTDSLIIVSVFALGCLLGLALFSRVLNYTFKNHKNQTIAVLSGFMLGSLFKIWPWRNPISWYDKTKDIVVDLRNDPSAIFDRADTHLRIMKEQNVFPSDYDYNPMTGAVILSFLLGIVLVIFLYRKINIKPREVS